MRRLLIYSFFGLIALFWIGVALIALELYERSQILQWQDAVRERRESIERDDATYLEGKPLLHEVPAEIASVRAAGPWRPLYAVPAGERVAYLRAQRSLALYLSEDGGLVEIAGYAEREELRHLAESVRGAGTLAGVVEQPLEAEVTEMLRRARAGESVEPDEYTLREEFGGRNITYEFLAGADPDSGAIAVLARPGVWVEYFESYRPHVYRPNFLDREEFWTNALGFRDEEIALPKPPGRYRIVCVGGSATVEGLRNDYTYPAQLERLLRERLDSDRIEVINAGVTGLNSAARANRIQDYLALDADLFLHCAFGNDVLMVFDAMRQEAGWRTDPIVSTWWIPLRSRFALAQSHRWFLPGEARMAAEIETRVMGYREDFLAAARDAGAEVAFASFPYPDLDAATELERRFLAEPMLWFWTYPALNVRCYTQLCAMYEARIQRFCEEHDVPYLPLAEGLRDADWYRDAAHMRAAGIERKAVVAADALESWLRERLAER